ncbi:MULTISPECIES: dATP/dGTP diphosphohydrolase domain-containing protein [Paracoccus]|uniref:dATP/dGTP diphosphohydrolase domain-containing protein n=1 Tax=Paracoccus TaxID=265 RepID=UPI0023F2E726|nr:MULTISPECIES: dATP/dGTP diphosphohydrolase domain-containing protein [Paracoccus]
MTEDGSTNPKAAVGRAKPPLHAIPPSAILWLGLAMEDGEKKYGLMNWRSRPVDAATYYDAAFRHLLAWWDGEREASDSKIHHLGHVMACCAILIDAEAQGTLVDNKPGVAGVASRMIEEMSVARKKAD